ncbi:MAG: WD40 repeat domain-containing protein, partial [Pirellulales bacterium]
MSRRSRGLLMICGIVASGMPFAVSVAPADGPPRSEVGDERVDLHGDPLPEHAVARLGTVRWLPQRSGRHSGFAWSPDGTRLASWNTAGYDGGIAIWDLATGREVGPAEVRETGNGGAAWSPDGKQLAVGICKFDSKAEPKDTWTVRIIDPASGKTLREVGTGTGACERIVWSRDGKWVAAGMSEWGKNKGRALAWDARTGKHRVTLKPWSGGLDVSSSGRVLASVSRDDAFLYDLDGLREAGRLEIEAKLIDDGPFQTYRRVGPAKFSPDGRRLAFANPGIWDHADVGKLVPWPDDPNDAFDLCFSPDGKRLCTLHGDSIEISRRVVLRDAASGKVLADRRWTGFAPFSAVAISFSPDGKRLPVPSRRIAFADAQTLEVLPDETGHRHLVTKVAISPDGKFAVSGELGPTAFVW